jgi:hypothetical protein
MTLRLGFVTNSSSTNHIIAWNGNRDDLAQLLYKHIKHFEDERDWISFDEAIDNLFKLILCNDSQKDKCLLAYEYDEYTLKRLNDFENIISDYSVGNGGTWADILLDKEIKIDEDDMFCWSFRDHS